MLKNLINAANAAKAAITEGALEVLTNRGLLTEHPEYNRGEVTLVGARVAPGLKEVHDGEEVTIKELNYKFILMDVVVEKEGYAPLESSVAYSLTGKFGDELPFFLTEEGLKKKTCRGLQRFLEDLSVFYEDVKPEIKPATIAEIVIQDIMDENSSHKAYLPMELPEADNKANVWFYQARACDNTVDTKVYTAFDRISWKEHSQRYLRDLKVSETSEQNFLKYGTDAVLDKEVDEWRDATK